MTAPVSLDRGDKGFPAAAGPAGLEDIASRGWNILDGDLPFPLAVIRRTDLEHNLAWMQAYADRKGVRFAPHGKTTMSPELFRMQLARGAWGITFATVAQMAVGLDAGVKRAVIANQVFSDADLAGLVHLLSVHSDARAWFLVDSPAQLALIEEWAAKHPDAHAFDVLIEIGANRTGCRTLEQAMAIARAMKRSKAVRLGGIECYEGLLANQDSEHDVREVSELVRRTVEAFAQMDAEGLFAEDEVLASAGGSAVFDLVIPLLRGQGLSRPVRGVLRSGCYVTHDHGNYTRFLANIERREGLSSSLRPALEVWTLVQSVPEPGLALLACGRRDISFDIEMPMPQRHLPRGDREARPAPEHWKVQALNDQHAYLRFDPASPPPAVGDRVVLGLSHPCTTFDKWRWMPIVEEDGRVGGAISTHF